MANAEKEEERGELWFPKDASLGNRSNSSKAGITLKLTGASAAFALILQ